MSEYLIFLLKSIGQRTVVGSFLVAGAVGIVGPATAWAADEGALGAVPFEFVGTVANCGGIAGSRIVTAAWLRGMGLSDSGGPNDPRNGLLLSKNGATADCSSAGASIKGVKGMVVTDTFELGFDYRNGIAALALRGSISTPIRASFSSAVPTLLRSQLRKIPSGRMYALR